jgi:hypothetical protein
MQEITPIHYYRYTVIIGQFVVSLIPKQITPATLALE